MNGNERMANGDAPADVDAATLLGDDYDAFESVLSGAATGPLAVVSAPFGGRELVLDAAAERLDATRIHLTPDGALGDSLTEMEAGPVVIDGCHHLYERRIGGFEPIERFLETLAHVDSAVVTGWNRYAWAYLAATRDVDREFPVHVEAGPVAAGTLAEHVLGRYGEMPRFVTNGERREGAIAVRHYSIGWRDYTWNIPVPVLTHSAATALRQGGDVDPKDVVFERLATVSDGNVGVATAIWERHRGAELRPSDIVASGAGREFDRDEAFCLRIVLAKECVERAELAEILGDGLDRLLGRLVREGLVGIEDGLVCLQPAAVPTVISGTERRRIL